MHNLGDPLLLTLPRATTLPALGRLLAEVLRLGPRGAVTSLAYYDAQVQLGRIVALHYRALHY
jgi:hypothetical protein